ncbi:hypothetical protein ABZ319_00505 [Nocardia sp. NPDC005978]|uniref:hypothetical protein n=1 Tax=Nocardia sp. NPDC005978 TaxID=3156725 RepID=UPI0033A97CCF
MPQANYAGLTNRAILQRCAEVDVRIVHRPITNPGIEPRTQDEIGREPRSHLNGTFEHTPNTNITLEMVRDWYVGVSRIRTTGRKAKPETKVSDDIPTARARAYEVIRMVLNVAVDDGLIDKNPCRIKGATAIQPAHDATVLQP